MRWWCSLAWQLARELRRSLALDRTGAAAGACLSRGVARRARCGSSGGRMSRVPYPGGNGRRPVPFRPSSVRPPSLIPPCPRAARSSTRDSVADRLCRQVKWRIANVGAQTSGPGGPAGGEAAGALRRQERVRRPLPPEVVTGVGCRVSVCICVWSCLFLSLCAVPQKRTKRHFSRANCAVAALHNRAGLQGNG